MSSSLVVLSTIILVLLILAQVNQTSTKSLDATTSKEDERNKVSPLLLRHEREAIIDKEDTGEASFRAVDNGETGRKRTKYSYYYLARSVLYFVLYYQLFYNFYFLAHIARSAFLHRVTQPPGHLPLLWGNFVYEGWPLYNKKDGRRGFEFDNEQLEPTYEINQEGIHNLTMTVLNAIKKFEEDYSDVSL